ncbi:hypothetical protein RFI_02138, partial [Reticulomyxa filosa]
MNIIINRCRSIIWTSGEHFALQLKKFSPILDSNNIRCRLTSKKIKELLTYLTVFLPKSFIHPIYSTFKVNFELYSDDETIEFIQLVFVQLALSLFYFHNNFNKNFDEILSFIEKSIIYTKKKSKLNFDLYFCIFVANDQFYVFLLKLFKRRYITFIYVLFVILVNIKKLLKLFDDSQSNNKLNFVFAPKKDLVLFLNLFFFVFGIFMKRFLKEMQDPSDDGDRLNDTSSPSAKKMKLAGNSEEVAVSTMMVECPVCKKKILKQHVNIHLDTECNQGEKKVGEGQRYVQSMFAPKGKIIVKGLSTNKPTTRTVNDVLGRPPPLHKATKTTRSWTQCPICQKENILSTQINDHLDLCLQKNMKNTNENKSSNPSVAVTTITTTDQEVTQAKSTIPCPVCNIKILASQINLHLDLGCDALQQNDKHKTNDAIYRTKLKQAQKLATKIDMKSFQTCVPGFFVVPDFVTF